MKALKPRQQTILNQLLDSQFPMTSKHIAELLEVSPRTVRYDLEVISDWLKRFEVDLKKVPKKGVWIENTQMAKEKIGKDLSRDEVITYRILTPEERRREILAILFAAEDYITVSALAQALGVSTSTCYTDLNNVEDWLSGRPIRLDKQAHKGYQLVGEETDWRNSLIDFLEEQIIERQQQKFTAGRKGTEHQREAIIEQQVIQQLFGDQDLKRVLAYIRSLEKGLKIDLTDNAFTGLVMHMAIAMKRLVAGVSIEMPQHQLDDLMKTREFKYIRALAEKKPFVAFSELPDVEMAYVVVHIKAAKQKKKRRNLDDFEDSGKDRLIETCIRQFIDSVSTQINYDLRYDSKLRDDLTVHLKPLIIRMAYDLRNRNPLLREIIRRYPMVFGACRKASAIFEEIFNIRLDEDEVAYLTLHVRAAIERTSEKVAKSKFNVLVVCSAGVGTSNILGKRLQESFPNIHQITEASVLDVHNMNLDVFDLVVTAVHLRLRHKIKVIQTSPLLKDHEAKKVGDYLEGLMSYSFKEQENLVNRLYEVINEHCTIEDPEGLLAALQVVLNKE